MTHDEIEQQARQDARALFETLTQRQREVIVLRAKGLSRDQCADALGLSERTTEAHFEHALVKLQVRTMVEAAVLAAKAGLV